MSSVIPIRSEDLALTHGLPSNVEYEKLILGAILTGADWGSVNSIVQESDFFIEKHRRIFARAGELFTAGQPVATPSVANELIRHKQLESVDGLSYLAELIDVPQIANIEHYCADVHEKYVFRQTIFGAQSLINRCILQDGDPITLLGDAEKFMREMGQSASAATNTLVSVHDIIANLNLNELGQLPKDVVRTPYSGLNSALVGMFPGELHVLGARPSAGKTAMAIETAMVAARQFHARGIGEAVAYFSLEMRQQAILTRMACNVGSVHAGKLRHGSLNSEERRNLLAALVSIKELPLFIDDKAKTCAEMFRAVRKMRQKPRLIIIDHLHLMESVGSGRRENRNQELSGITRSLKLFANDTGATIQLLAQLNRDSDKGGAKRPPEMSDLRDSGSIEADADVIGLLHRKETVAAADKKLPVPVDLIIAKQREGITFISIPFLLEGKFLRFVELGEEHSYAA